MMKRKFYVSLILLVCMLFAVACSSTSKPAAPDNSQGASQNQPSKEAPAQKPVKLKLVSFLAMDHQLTKDIVPMWKKKIEEATGGAVTVEWVGGPESIPVTDQFDAVKNGIVEVGFAATAYYAQLMPEANSIQFSPFTPAEERKNGYFDYMNERLNKQGIVYGGRWLSELPFYFWSNSKVDSFDGMKGLRVRSNPTYHPILLKIGINPIEIAPGDVYTALERKMIDGFGFPLIGPRNSGWVEHTKYIIDEPFLNQNTTILINKKVFDSLTPEIQKKMTEATAQFEQDMIAYFKKMNESEWKEIEKKGVNRIKLSKEDSAKFQKAVNDSYWEMLQKVTPDQVGKLKELFTKK